MNSSSKPARMDRRTPVPSRDAVAKDELRRDQILQVSRHPRILGDNDDFLRKASEFPSFVQHSGQLSEAEDVACNRELRPSRSRGSVVRGERVAFPVNVEETD